MNWKFQKIFLLFVLVIAVFILGLFFGLSSWDKNLYVEWNPVKRRGLAEAKNSSEILNIKSEYLTQKPSELLFSPGQILTKGSLKAFKLGNIFFSNSKSDKAQFVCEKFSLVEFTFVSLGVNVNGETGLMVLQSPCYMENEEFIGPFWIPYKEILEKPSHKSFTVSEKETFIHFYNTSSALNSRWLLKRVRFFNEQDMDGGFLVHYTPGQVSGSYFEIDLKEHSDFEDGALPEPAE